MPIDCHAPRMRSIQYAVNWQGNNECQRILDHPLSRVMTEENCDDGRRLMTRQFQHIARWITAILLLATPAHAREMLPPGFTYLRDIDSSIAQDIRYATADNFTGHPLPGYGAAECILRRETAGALKRVQADLARENLGLKVYDCYRPARAVRAMADWAHDGKDDETTRRFYPALHKRNLFALGYIAAQSKHSTGTTVDLTLIKLPAASAPRFDPVARYGPCTGPFAKRAPDNSIDMGTGFDCFDTRSYGTSSAIAPEQRRWRTVLNTAMRRHGFANYFREWWHYSFTGAAEPRTYDFAITPRGR
jgi:zinc D-Ala-D-Ala dipeptidase